MRKTMRTVSILVEPPIHGLPADNRRRQRTGKLPLGNTRYPASPTAESKRFSIISLTAFLATLSEPTDAAAE